MPSPLIQALVERHALPRLDLAGLDDFLAGHDNVVLFFAGNPAQHPESNDLAVILPELLKQLAGRLQGALVDAASETALQARYGFSQWPSLVFLRRGEYLGTIERLQDWSGYLERIDKILGAAPSRPPSINVPVVDAAGEQLH